jgi:regulator of protease activity HflC (stomatin/prohibitin superfamily)
MIALKTLLMMVGVLLMTVAAGIPLHGLWMQLRYVMRKKSRGDGMLLESGEPEPAPIMWKVPVALALVGCLPLLIAGSMVVVPSGMGGVKVSQTAGTKPGTLYPGLHFVTPMIESVQMFDLRDHMFTAGVVDAGKPGTKNNMMVQSREGLNIGLAVTVRYRLDPNKLASVQAHLPQPADQQLVPPVVASAWRELAPGYTVREIFSSKREEMRNRAAGIITKKLSADGIVVEEVMLADIQLPEQYAKAWRACC